MAKNLDINIRTHGAAQAQQQLKGIEGAAAKIRTAFAAAGVAMAGKKVLQFIGESIQAYMKQETAVKKLQTALGYTSKSLNDYASSLQKVTIYGDEQIIQAEAMIAAFVKDEESIKKATKATMDLASFLGMDLFSSAALVAKTLGSTTDALSRYSIKTTGAVGSVERLKSMIEGINKAAGGQAEAMGTTFIGQIQQARNAYDDLKEEIGAYYVMWLKVIYGSQGKVRQVFEVLSSDVKKFTGTVRSMFEFFGLLAPVTEKYTDTIKSVNIETAEEAKRFNDLILKLREMNNAYKESIPTYDEWLWEKNEDLKMTKLLAQYQEIYLQGLRSQGKIPMGTTTVIPGMMQPKTEKGVEQITKEGEKAAIGLTDTWGNFAESFVGSFQGMFDEALFREKGFADAMVAGVRGMLERILAELAARAAIFALFSLLIPNFGKTEIGTGGLGGFLKKTFGFQHGGAFTVGGGGGADSQMVAFRASPGERVTISPPGQTNNSTTKIINVNIAGNMIGNRRFVRDVVIPEIDIATQRGL